MKASRLATAITAAAACAAIGLIVVSCSSQSGSPVAPGATANLAANIETSPTPTPTPTPTPPSGTPCSPGFWKTHETEFATFCQAAADVPGDQFTTCSDLFTAISCTGNQPGCTGARRQAAAAALNSVSACTEPTP